MNTHNRPRVLAFAIDAAEPTLIHQMIEQNEMPTLRSLLAEGRWLSVKSPADIGSGAVWASFLTGEDPLVHGFYGEWCWEADQMGVQRVTGRELTPFWKTFAENGTTLGILDVPFMTLVGLTRGFEVAEWGPHELLEGRIHAAPEGVANLISNQAAHPLSYDRLDSGGPDDYENLERLTSASVDGIKLRGSLAQSLIGQTQPGFSLIAFTEIHHAAHFLWHTVEPDHGVYANSHFGNLRAINPTLKDIYREVDRQVGALIQSFGEAATIMVFSLHGMQPSHGVPALLSPVLCEKGFSRLADWKSQSWSERAISFMAAAKRHSPTALRKLYYKTVPATATQRLARPTMMAAYDWSRTRAFSLPSDQHGWIRINLKGREARGTVPMDEYDGLRQEITDLVRSLTTEDGKPLAREVIHTAGRGVDRLRLRLPDMVVHWEDEVFRTPLHISGSSVVSQPVGQKYNGQHALEGFCIVKGAENLDLGNSIRAEDIHHVISKGLQTSWGE